MKWLYLKGRGHRLEIPTKLWLGTLAMIIIAFKGPEIVPGVSLILRLVMSVVGLK